ncbi:MAG: RNA polymerase sigma factor [Solirubrobacteraceae bacterium]
MSELVLPRSAAGERALGGRMLSDELLARLVGRGSTRAFSILYERHHQALYRYCRSILRDEHDAQDALQSTMAQAYAALSAKEREVSLRAWLFRIAHNESITILRKHGRELELDQSGLQAQAEDDPHALLESRGRLRQLVCDLHELPERQRSALVMRELSGLHIEEIAVALASTPAAAKQALFEARSSLHELAGGREMDCEKVCLAISAHDRRVLRGRRIRAHLRDCESCRDFQMAIGAREADLRALAPVLPASAATTILARLIGAGHWGGSAGSGGAAVAGSSSSSPSLLAHAGGSLLIKSAAGAAMVAVTAVGTVHLTRTSTPNRRVQTGPLRVLDSPSTSRADLSSGAVPDPIVSSAGARAGSGAAATQTLGAAPPRGHEPGEPRARAEQTANGQAHHLGEKPVHGKSRQNTHVHVHGERHGSAPAKGRSNGSAHGRADKPTTHHSAGKSTPIAKKDSPTAAKRGKAHANPPSSQTEGSAVQTSSGSISPAGGSAHGRSGHK